MEFLEIVRQAVLSFLGARRDIDISWEAATSLFALFAVAAAFLQASAASDGNRAHLYVEFSERYTSEEMAKALVALSNWHHARKDDPTRFVAWARAKRANDPGALELSRARRLVSRYYYDVAALHELGLIKRRFAHALLSSNGLNVFYLVCDPLNRAYQPEDRLNQHYRRLKRLRDKFGDGEIYDASRD